MSHNLDHLPEQLREQSERADDSGYGHTAAIFSDSADELERCWKRIAELEDEAGGVTSLREALLEIKSAVGYDWLRAEFDKARDALAGREYIDPKQGNQS